MRARVLDWWAHTYGSAGEVWPPPGTDPDAMLAEVAQAKAAARAKEEAATARVMAFLGAEDDEDAEHAALMAIADADLAFADDVVAGRAHAPRSWRWQPPQRPSRLTGERRPPLPRCFSPARPPLQDRPYEYNPPRPAFGYDRIAAAADVGERNVLTWASWWSDNGVWVQAAMRGDVETMLLAAWYGNDQRPIGEKFARTPLSEGPPAVATVGLLEAVLWTGMTDTVVETWSTYGHTALIDRLAAEALSPPSGTARHRERIRQKGLCLLEELLAYASKHGRPDVVLHAASSVVPPASELAAASNKLAQLFADADRRSAQTPLLSLTATVAAGAAAEWAPLQSSILGWAFDVAASGAQAVTDAVMWPLHHLLGWMPEHLDCVEIAAAIRRVRDDPNGAKAATPFLLQCALHSCALALVHLLRRRGVPWPWRAVELARKSPRSYHHEWYTLLLIYLHRHRAPGAASVTAAECDPVENGLLGPAQQLLAGSTARLTALLQPAVGLFRSRRPVLPLALDALPLGCSRMGGLPDLPPTLAWPLCQGAPLAFLLQIDLADVASAASRPVADAAITTGHDDVLPLLPKRGWLWFFLEMDHALYGHDDVPNSTVVLHWDGPREALQRTRNPLDRDLDPADLAEFGTGFAAHPMTARPIVTAPPITHNGVRGFTERETSALRTIFGPHDDAGGARHATVAFDRDYVAADVRRVSLGAANRAWHADVHVNCLQVGGHPDEVQGDIFNYIPAEVVSAHAGLQGPTSDDDPGPADAVLAERRTEWVLLLQIPCDGIRYFSEHVEHHYEDASLDLGDAGSLYVCIRRSDLVARRFDKTFTVFQCC